LKPIEFDYKTKEDEGASEQYQGLSIPSFDWSKEGISLDEDKKRAVLSKLCYEENPYLAVFMDHMKQIFAFIEEENEKKGIGRKITAIDAIWVYATSRLNLAMDYDILDRAQIEPNLKHAIIEYCDIRASEVGPMYKYIMRNSLDDEINSNKEESEKPIHE